MAFRIPLLVLVLASAVTALAQDPNPPQTPATKTPVVKERQMIQKSRIHQGVKSGELTKGEAAKLKGEQKTIQAEKRMAKEDGKVTPAERAKLRHDQNKASKDIHRMKHNDKMKGTQPETK